MLRAFIDTPVGPLVVLASDEALCALEFVREGRVAHVEARLARWFGTERITDGTNAIVERVRDWLRAYFSGISADTSPLTLDLRGGPFQLRVWQALRNIAPGATTSYGAIARQIGSPGASRAVGLANGANPMAIIIPCHRVIGANGALTGYGGGLDRKSWLLDHERRWRPRHPHLLDLGA